MATLVLTVVGGIVGGPVGAAIGGMIGQTIDRNVLFKPKGREGPRLTELALQTSSYGAPIAQVFGTMRVGGCVIWSTDLIESRSSSSAGKGQPKVTSYSYSASFAVALSGRRIAAVGRIWADGKLLRGAAGDFKSQTGFRLHLGGEDQPVDPLIAAAENGMAPAHRGIAYAVFEDLQLADYGNRIPSLTFEVIGDAGPVRVDAVAAAISGGLVKGEVSMPLPGFAAYGNARAVLEMLASASGAWFAPDGARLRMHVGTTATHVLADAGLAAGERVGQRGVRTLRAIDGVARTITCSHYDPARDYQTGLQRVRRPGPGEREERIELPGVISADSAKTIAGAAMARAEAERERRTVTLGWGDLDVMPGTCVSIAGAPGVYRVSGWSFESMVLKLDCVRLAVATAPASASSGRMLAAPDAVAGTTILHAFELPPLDDAVLSAPRLMVAAAGTGSGWRRAAVLYSLDDGTRWISADPASGAATLGVLVKVPGTGPVGLIDRHTRIEVDLAHEEMALAGADWPAIDGGTNTALVGDELIQFGGAEQIAPRRWRLFDLLRGVRGTESAMAGQKMGDRFVLIEPDTITAIDLPLSNIGTDVRVMAAGIGDVTGPVGVNAAVRGISVLPPTPVHLRAKPLPGGDIVVRWIRRSRAGWRWIDGVDAPIGEERELYRVTIVLSDGAARTVETLAPELFIPAAGGAAEPVRIAVRQVGSFGESPAAVIELPIIVRSKI